MHDHTAILSVVNAQYSQLDSRSSSHPNFNNLHRVSISLGQVQSYYCTWDYQRYTTERINWLVMMKVHTPTLTISWHTCNSANKRIYSQSGEYKRYKYLKVHNFTKLKDGYIVLLPDNISELDTCVDLWKGKTPGITYCSIYCSNLFQSQYSESVSQIRLTSAPMTCFIMYSQLVVLAICEDCNRWAARSAKLIGQIKFTDSGETRTLRVGTRIFFTMYGMFNLDYIFSPFCISTQFRPIHIISLGYISVFYPFSANSPHMALCRGLWS